MLFVALLSLAGVALGRVAQNSRVGLPLHYSLANDVPVAPSLPLKSTDEIMDYANAKVTAGLQDTLAQLNLILNLNGTRQGLQLESELAILKSNIMNRLRSDLLNKIDNVKWSRDKDQEETEEERLRFSQTLQLKWESSVNEELEKWKRNSLPLWVQKALPVWKGVESQMKNRVEKYTKIVQENSMVMKCGTSALYDTDSTTALSQTDLQELEKRGVALGILAAFGIAMIAFVLLMVTFPILSVIGAIVFPFVIVFGLLDLIFGGSN